MRSIRDTFIRRVCSFTDCAKTVECGDAKRRSEVAVRSAAGRRFFDFDAHLLNRFSRA